MEFKVVVFSLQNCRDLIFLLRHDEQVRWISQMKMQAHHYFRSNNGVAPPDGFVELQRGPGMILGNTSKQDFRCELLQYQNIVSTILNKCDGTTYNIGSDEDLLFCQIGIQGWLTTKSLAIFPIIIEPEQVRKNCKIVWLYSYISLVPLLY